MKKLRSLKFTVKIFLLSTTVFTLFHLMTWSESDPTSTSRRWLKKPHGDVASLLDASVESAPVAIDVRTSRVESFVQSFESVFSKSGISCPDLFEGSEDALRRSRDYMKRSGSSLPDLQYYYEVTKNCTDFRRRRGYLTVPESDEEAEFPIAFSLLVYVDFQMAERLLRSIYAPQNFYCIHVDAGVEDGELRELLGRVADCLPNVFLAEGAVRVHWGHSSIVRADAICMEQLLKYKWKYFVNLSGRMFPLRTNAELVRILKLFNGANDVSGSSITATNPILQLRQTVEWYHSELLGMNVFSFRRKSPPPHNVTIFTGSNQAVLSRAFVVYFLYSEVSRDITDWFSNTLVPDEYVWPTLNHNPHLRAPGGYLGDAEKKISIARLTLWRSFLEDSSWKCQGFWERDICIFGVGDLQWLVRQPHLFINKFHSDSEWLAIDCMEELIFNRTANYIREKLGRPTSNVAFPNIPLNISYYESMQLTFNQSHVIQLKDSALYKFCKECS